MSNITKAITAALSLIVAGLAHATLNFGVFPNLSSRLLMESYQPVADALAASLGQPVVLQTAPDFRTFALRTQAGEYDLVLTASHLAWLAHKEQGYRPLFTYQSKTRGLLVVRADSPYHAARDLRGKRIAKSDSLAITVMRMENELVRDGLVGGRDYTVVETGSHNNAVLHVQGGQAEGAILGALPWRQMPATLRGGLRVIRETEEFPGQVYLVHPRTDKTEKRIRDALEAYMASEQGRRFLVQNGLGGLQNITAGELRRFDLEASKVKSRLPVTGKTAQ